MAIKLDNLTFHKQKQVRDEKKKLNKKLAIVPETSKRHSIHDMMLSEEFMIKEPKKRVSILGSIQPEVSKSTSLLSISETKAYTNVVSFIKTSANTTGNLIRSKSAARKKREIQLTTTLPEFVPHQMHFYTLLLHTMKSGGYITPNLYITKDLWYQPHVRLTGIDTKVAICNTIRIKLQQMNERTDFSDSISIEQDLTVLEITLRNMERTIKRKLWTPSQETQENKQDRNVISHSIRRSAHIGSLINEKANHIKHSQTKSEQNSIYIQHLIDVFTLADVFGIWNKKLVSVHKQDIIEHLTSCLKLFITIMNKFVMKDYELLLDKWLSQSSSQFLDL